MLTLEFRFAIFLTTVLFALGLLQVKGDIAPDIVLLNNSDGNSMYEDPMEYQRTKRSYIHEDDNEDDNDDDDIGDEGFDEDEYEDDRSDSLGKNLNYPGLSILHKKDEIHQMHVKAAGLQQPLKTEEDGESTDDSGSSDDNEGSSSGSGSGEVREERPYARQHVSDKEDDTDEDASADEEETSGSGDLDQKVKKYMAEENTTGGAPLWKPRNLIKMVLEESNDAEREEKLERENDEENSGQESGSSASFVRGSGEIGVYHEEEHPVPKPLPKNVPQVSNSTSGKDIANKSESLHKETHLHPNDQVGEVDDDPKKKSATSKSQTKVEMKSQDLKPMAHKEVSTNKEKPKEDEESSRDKTKHSSHVQDAKIHKKHKKKAHIRVSKVSHLAKKRLHHKHLTAHVTHPRVVENHLKVVHKMPVIEASSQMCHSDKILAGHSLKGGTRAGHFQTLGETASMHACLQRCCSRHPCDVALLIDGRCYGVACFSKELCEAIPVPHPHFVFSQLGFISKGQKRGDIEKNQEFHCRYGNLTLRNNEQWSGELCGGVVRCKDGITTVKKCSGIPPKPDDCAKPRLIVKHRSGKCCHMKWKCKARHCTFNSRVIKHGYKLSDPLCTGVVSCYNGHLNMEYCPKIPEKPKNCARPKLKTINVPGKCCKKLWVCSDKNCAYDGLKLSHGEKLTDASCAVVMECRNGFLHNKQCPGPPPVPHTCINPLLRVKRVPGECCEMNWTCEMS